MNTSTLNACILVIFLIFVNECLYRTFLIENEYRKEKARKITCIIQLKLGSIYFIYRDKLSGIFAPFRMCILNNEILFMSSIVLLSSCSPYFSKEEDSQIFDCIDTVMIQQYNGLLVNSAAYR